MDQTDYEEMEYPYPTRVGEYANNKQYLVADDVEGLFLRIYATGRKTWFVRFTTRDGDRHLSKLGDFDRMPLTAARRKAGALLQEVADGKDPHVERKAARDAYTVAELCDEFIERYARPFRKTWKEDQQKIRDYIKPALGTRKAETVTRGDVARFHARIGSEKGHRVANKVANLIRRIWGLGIEWGLLGEQTVNPGKGIKRFPETTRDRWLRPDEMRRLLEAIEAESSGEPMPDQDPSVCRQIVELLKEYGPLSPQEVAQRVDYPRERISILLSDMTRQGRLERVDRAIYRALPLAPDPLSPYVRAALLLYILIGVRKNELLSRRWDDVDLEAAELRIPDSKAGHPIRLPLPPSAVAILRDLPKVLGNPHIFVGRKEGQHLVNIDKPWRRVRKRAGLKNVRLHDLRHTLGAWLAAKGTSLLTIQRALGHRSYRSTLVYAHMDLDPVRRALEDHDRVVTDILNPISSAEVIDLESRR